MSRCVTLLICDLQPAWGYGSVNWGGRGQRSRASSANQREAHYGEGRVYSVTGTGLSIDHLPVQPIGKFTIGSRVGQDWQPRCQYWGVVVRQYWDNIGRSLGFIHHAEASLPSMGPTLIANIGTMVKTIGTMLGQYCHPIFVNWSVVGSQYWVNLTKEIGLMLS